MRGLALLLGLVGCATPDYFEIGAGHTWPHDGEAWAPGGTPRVGINEGPSDWAWFTLGWNLKPMWVRVTQAAPEWPDMPFEPRLEPQKRESLTEPPETELEESWFTVFERLHPGVQSVLILLAGWFGWIYRKTVTGYFKRFTNGTPA